MLINVENFVENLRGERDEIFGSSLKFVRTINNQLKECLGYR